MNDEEREIRAFESIIVSQLLRDRDPTNIDDLPELTKEQREAIAKLPSDLVDKLWDQVEEHSECPSEETCHVTEDEEEFVGMNRAEEMDDETRKQLDEARREVRESMRRQREDENRADD